MRDTLPNAGCPTMIATDTSSKFCAIPTLSNDEFCQWTINEMESFFSAIIRPPMARYSLIRVAYTTLIPPIETILSAVLFLLFNPHINQIMRTAMTINTIDMIVRTFPLLGPRFHELVLWTYLF